MSTENDVARSLRSWLRENRHEDADRVLDAVFDQVPATPQRSAGWLARRFPPMNSNMRIALAAAAVVVVAIVGITLLLPRTDVGGPAESASPTAIPDGMYETVVSETEQASDDQGLCPCTWAFTIDGDQFGLTTPGEEPTRVEFSGDRMTLPNWNQGILPDPSISVRWVFDPAAQTVTFSDMVGGAAGDKLVFERTWTKVATASPPRLDRLPEGDLAAGTYEIDKVFPVRLTFTVPDGFGHGRGGSDGVGIQGNPSGRGIEFQIASNVYPDPCHTFAGPANPPIGPSVDDLVTAMTTLVDFQAGPVTDITIGGLPAKAFDLTNEIDQSTCDGESVSTFIFAESNGASGVGQGERQRIYVMDVQGTRLMVMTYYFSDETGSTDASEAARLAAIVQSITFP